MADLALAGKSILVVDVEPVIDAFRSWPEAPVISKPVEGRVLIDAVAGILN